MKLKYILNSIQDIYNYVNNVLYYNDKLTEQQKDLIVFYVIRMMKSNNWMNDKLIKDYNNHPFKLTCLRFKTNTIYKYDNKEYEYKDNYHLYFFIKNIYYAIFYSYDNIMRNDKLYKKYDKQIHYSITNLFTSHSINIKYDNIPNFTKNELEYIFHQNFIDKTYHSTLPVRLYAHIQSLNQQNVIQSNSALITFFTLVYIRQSKYAEDFDFDGDDISDLAYTPTRPLLGDALFSQYLENFEVPDRWFMIDKYKNLTNDEIFTFNHSSFSYKINNIEYVYKENALYQNKYKQFDNIIKQLSQFSNDELMNIIKHTNQYKRAHNGKSKGTSFDWNDLKYTDLPKMQINENEITE